MQLRKILNELGHDIVGEAENGLDAIEKFKTLQPQLVLMDITMPVLGGIDAVKEIMKIDPNGIIIMCSAMGQQGIVIDAVNAGAKGFIVKPFDSMHIQQALQNIII
jgi:two-component system chemotaxis response regulator CheY